MILESKQEIAYTYLVWY